MVSGIAIGADLAVRTGFYRAVPNVLYLSYPLEYALGPLLFVTLSLLTDHRFIIRKRQLLLFVVPALVAVLLLPYYFLSAEEKVAHIQLHSIDNTFLGTIYFIIDRGIEPWIFLCVVLFLRRVAILHRMGAIKWNQLNRFGFLYGIAWGIWSLAFAVIIIGGFDGLHEIAVFSGSLLGVLMFFYAIRKPLFLVNSKSEDGRYKKSSIAGIDIERLVRRFEELFWTDRIHLDENVTLSDVSGRLNIHSHQLSEVLNTRLNCSFTTYINRHRVATAQTLLIEHPDRTILSIAYDSGFRSKSAFNAVFRQETGLTPSMFRQTKGTPTERVPPRNTPI